MDSRMNVLSIQDNSMKFLHLAPIAELTSATIVFETTRFITTFGIVESIFTHQDRKFCSEFMKYTYESLGIHKMQCNLTILKVAVVHYREITAQSKST